MCTDTFHILLEECGTGGCGKEAVQAIGVLPVPGDLALLGYTDTVSDTCQVDTPCLKQDMCVVLGHYDV